VTSVWALVAPTHRQRRNEAENYRTSGRPAYYQNHNHIRVKRVCLSLPSLFPHPPLKPIPSVQREAMLQGNRKEDANLTERRCLKRYSKIGTRSLFDFPLPHCPAEHTTTRDSYLPPPPVSNLFEASACFLGSPYRPHFGISPPRCDGVNPSTTTADSGRVVPRGQYPKGRTPSDHANADPRLCSFRWKGQYGIVYQQIDRKYN